MADVQVNGAGGAVRELQEEKERSQKMKQENQVLLKKLHDVVGRYRQLQQQYQTMVNERQDQQSQLGGDSSTSSADGAKANGDGSPTNHSTVLEDAAAKKLEAEKHELIEKLKQVVGTCRIMQKQLQEAKEENEALKSPGKPMLGGMASPAKDSAEATIEALQVRIIGLERDVAQKEEEKQEIVGKLKEVIARYQSLQRQLEEKMGEHDAAMFKVAALELELRTQQTASSSSSSSSSSGGSWMRRGSGQDKDNVKDKEISKLKDDLQKLTVAMTQEEARTAVFREENARLKEQITAVQHDKQERDHQFEAESAAHAKQLGELQKEIKLMRKQQEDSEQLYLEVASKLNHTLRENGDLQTRLTSLQRAAEEAEQLQEQSKRNHAAELEQLRGQVEQAKAAAHELATASANEQLTKLQQQMEGLAARAAKLFDLESELAQCGVGSTYASITDMVAKFDAKYEHETAAASVRIEELTKASEATASLHHQQLQETLKRLEEFESLANQVPDLTQELDALRAAAAAQLSSLNEMESVMNGLRTSLVEKDEELATTHSAVAAHKEEITRLGDQLAEMESKLATATACAAASVAELEQFQQKEMSLTEELAVARDEFKTKNDEIQELQHGMADLRNALATKETEMNGILEERDQLKASIDDIRASQASESDAVAKLLAELEALRELHAEALSAKDAAHEAIASALQQEIDVKLAAISDLETTSEQLKTQHEERSQAEVASLTGTIDTLRSECDAVSAEKTQLAQEVEKLEQQLSELQQTHESDQRGLLELNNARVSELESELTKRDAAAGALRDENETLTADMASARAQHALAASAADDSTKEGQAIQREQLDATMADFEARLAKKEDRIATLQVEIASLQTQVMTWEAQELQSDADSAEIKQLREQLAATVVERESALTESAHRLTEIMDLQAQLSQMATDHEALLEQTEFEFNETRSELMQEVEDHRNEMEKFREELVEARHFADVYAQEAATIRDRLASLPLKLHSEDAEVSEGVDVLLTAVSERLGEIDEYESQISGLTSSTSALRDELAAATAELEHVQSRCETYESEIQSLNLQLQASTEEMSRQAEERETDQAKQVEHAYLIQRMEQTIAELEEQKQSVVSSALQASSDELADAKLKLTDLESEVSAIKAENMRMVFEVAKTTDSAVKLKQDFEELQIQWKSKCADVERLEEARRELEMQVAKFTEDVQANDKELDALRKELEAHAQNAEESKQQLSDQLIESNQRLEDVQQQLSTMSDNNVMLQQELAAANAALAERGNLSDELVSWKEQVEVLEQETQRLKEQVVATDVNRQTLADELLVLQASTTQQINVLEATVDAKTSELHESAQALEIVEAEKRTLDEKVRILEAQIEELRSAVGDHSAQMIALQASTTQQINVLEATVDAKTSELLESAQALSAVEAEKMVLGEKIRILERQIEEHSAAVSHHSTQLDSVKEDLSNQVEQLTTENVRAHEIIDELKVARQDVEEALRNVKTLLEEQEAHFVSAAAQVSSLEEQVANLAEQIAAKDQELGAAIASADSKLSESEDELATLRAQLVESTATIAEKEERISELESAAAARAETTAELETKLSESARLTEDEMSTLRAQVVESTATIAEKEKRISELESAVAAHAETTAELETKLSESARITEDELTTLRAQVAECTTMVTQKEEIISKLKSKTEDVVGMYKKLKEHAQDIQERLSERVEELGSLKLECESLSAANQQLTDEAACADELRVALQEELNASKAEVSLMQEQTAQSTTSLTQELAAAKAELTTLQEQHKTHVNEVNSSFAARQTDLEAQVKELETHKMELIKTVESKDVENQEVVDKMKELLTRYRELQDTHRQLEDEMTSVKSELAQSIAHVATLQSEHAGRGAAHEDAVTNLQSEVQSLRAQLDVEVEGANAARTALEVYKKRAATALKKASHESKSSIKKVEVETSQLQDEINAANARVAVLEQELCESKARLDEANAVAASQVRAVKEKLENEKSHDAAAWKQQIETIQSELGSLRAELQAKSHLDVRIQELEDLKNSLESTVESLKKEMQQKSEVAKEMMKVKDGEIAQLTKQLEEATRAASEAADQLKKAAQQSSSSSQTTLVSTSSVPTEHLHPNGSRAPTSGTEAHHHLAAAVADVPSSIPMAATASSEVGVDGQILKLARAQAMRDEEATKSKKQLKTLEEQAHLYQKKYEDALALLEESNRQKRRIQELSARTTDGLNIEYLKNVVIKYIESQNQSEKDRLLPVIATVLHFSPHEMKKIHDAHQKAQEENAGLLGGVFSLFSAAPAAPAPKPLAVPANLNPRSSSTGTISGGGTGVDQDEDDQITPLNPFASNNY